MAIVPWILSNDRTMSQMPLLWALLVLSILVFGSSNDPTEALLTAADVASADALEEVIHVSR